jgi:hypothetical protein
MNAAAMHNSKEIFNNFRAALIESFKRRKDPETKELLYKDLNSDNIEDRTKAEQKFATEVLSDIATPSISNIMLLSSGPGFGKSTYIPELTVTANKHANGGKIHIKPSHRGRLTELKKRTGKSEAELYKTGGPAVRKMITFARNSRKWKHGLGGLLEI